MLRESFPSSVNTTSLFSSIMDVPTLTHVFYQCALPCDLPGRIIIAGHNQISFIDGHKRVCLRSSPQDSHITQTQRISVTHWQHVLSCASYFSVLFALFSVLCLVGNSLQTVGSSCHGWPEQYDPAFVPYLSLTSVTALWNWNTNKSLSFID